MKPLDFDIDPAMVMHESHSGDRPRKYGQTPEAIELAAGRAFLAAMGWPRFPTPDEVAQMKARQNEKRPPPGGSGLKR